MILWHPRQRSTDGRPAYSERRASAWQYWQSSRDLRAWMRWLKKIGCVGARGAVTIGTTAAARNGGNASERTWRITWRICASLRYSPNAGMPGESPSTDPPCLMTLARKSSGSPFMRRPSARFEGLVAKPAAEAVALPRRAVTECALRGIERLARLEIDGRRRRAGPGGRPQPDEDRDENDRDTETGAERAPCPGRAGVHATL